jgi:hypothetical protein
VDSHRRIFIWSLHFTGTRQWSGARQSSVTDVPDLVQWGDIEGFRYQDKSETLYEDLHIREFLNHVRDTRSLKVDRLKQRRAYAVFTDGRPPLQWSIYRCIHGEVDLDDHSLVLSGGKWFRIDQGFVTKVNAYVDGLLGSYPLPNAKSDEGEPAYNRRVAKRAGYTCMDGKNIVYGGGRSKVEFCDLFTKDRVMIHVKRYGGSGVLSHLFAQGAASAARQAPEDPQDPRTDHTPQPKRLRARVRHHRPPHARPTPIRDAPVLQPRHPPPPHPTPEGLRLPNLRDLDPQRVKPPAAHRSTATPNA